MTFKPGNKWQGNAKGRPLGSGHRQELFNDLVMPHKKSLIDKALSLAINGDTHMLRLFLERMLPAKPSDEPILLELPSETLNSATMVTLGNDTLRALEQRKITPSEARSLFDVIKSYRENLSFDDLFEKLTRMEKSLQDHINSPIRTGVKKNELP